MPKSEVKYTEFNYSMPDSNGYVPDMALIGQQRVHTGNHKTYAITGFVWIGESDEWGYTHTELDAIGPTIVRPMSSLTGNRANGEPRYAPVDE